jgi:hypothetical protein
LPEYLASGVYLEESDRGPRPIDGVATSTAAFIGETERGALKPRLVTSFDEYRRWFGGNFDDAKYLPHAVKGFFENGGNRLYVCRVVGAQATPAEAVFGPFVVRAVGPGSWGRRVWARIDDSTATASGPGGTPQPVGFRLRLAYWADAPASQPLFDPFADGARLPRPTLVEDFDDLVTDSASLNFYQTRLLDCSALAVLVREAVAPADARPANGSQALGQNGTDDPNALVVADYQGGLLPGTSPLPSRRILRERSLRTVSACAIASPSSIASQARRVPRSIRARRSWIRNMPRSITHGS